MRNVANLSPWTHALSLLKLCVIKEIALAGPGIEVLGSVVLACCRGGVAVPGPSDGDGAPQRCGTCLIIYVLALCLRAERPRSGFIVSARAGDFREELQDRGRALEARRRRRDR